MGIRIEKKASTEVDYDVIVVGTFHIILSILSVFRYDA